MYPPEIESQMTRFYLSLSEKDRRRYAAIEAMKLGHGGQSYICKLLGCNPRTINRGIEELKDQELLQSPKIRQAGGGRPSTLSSTLSSLDETFLEIMREQTAGSPMDESIKWSNLSKSAIRGRLKVLGFSVSRPIIQQLLDKHGFRKRKALKTVAGGQSKNRNEQFKNIERLKKKYQQSANPMISMDTKKKS